MRFRISAMIAVLFLAAMCTASRSAAAEENPLLVQAPTMSKTQIVFAYGGYLWSVPREGGEARQLTTNGHEAQAEIFSGRKLDRVHGPVRRQCRRLCHARRWRRTEAPDLASRPGRRCRMDSGRQEGS